MLPRKFICVNFFFILEVSVKNLGKIYLLNTQQPENVLEHKGMQNFPTNQVPHMTFHMYACYNYLNRYKPHIYN